MDNYGKIMHMSREELATLLDRLINDGGGMLPLELDEYGIEDGEEVSGEEEVLRWLSLDTL